MKISPYLSNLIQLNDVEIEMLFNKNIMIPKNFMNRLRASFITVRPYRWRNILSNRPSQLTRRQWSVKSRNAEAAAGDLDAESQNPDP